MPRPPDLATLLNDRDCRDCVIGFTTAFDAGDRDGMLARFAPDGVWERVDGVLRGREGLRAFMDARSIEGVFRHVLSNMRLEIADDRASCRSYVLVYRGAGGPALPLEMQGPLLLGEYVDQLERCDGRWLIVHRRVIVTMQAKPRAP